LSYKILLLLSFPSLLSCPFLPLLCVAYPLTPDPLPFGLAPFSLNPPEPLGEAGGEGMEEKNKRAGLDGRSEANIKIFNCCIWTLSFIFFF
jgi:hypothetical protein